MEGKEYNVGMNFEIASADNVEQAADRSYKMRSPLRDAEVGGATTQGKVRPHWVEQAIEEVNDLAARLIACRNRLALRLQEAEGVGGVFIPGLIVAILILSDGLLLGPIIANAIETFKADWLRLLVGLAVSFIIALGGWAVAFAIHRLVPDPYDVPVAIAVAGLLGGLTGGYIGSAGDATRAGVIIRAILTSCSLMAMAGLHFLTEAGAKAWGAVRVVRKELKMLEKKKAAAVAELRQYQDQCLEALEKHNRDECGRHEGLITGRQARQEGVRAAYVQKRFASWLDRLFAPLALCLIPLLPAKVEAKTEVVVLDITESIAVRQVLVERAMAEIPLGFGETVEAYTLGCQGLSFVYRGEVLKVSKPRHRQSLAQVKEELEEALKQAATQSKDGKCTPLIDSLLTLAANLRVRVEQGEETGLLVASDFLTNTDRFKLKGQPFLGIEVVAVLPMTTGKDLSGQENALKLIRQLFSGAKSLRFAQ